MICAPLIGCVESSFCTQSSAGGQLEQPSEVNSSSRIGYRALFGAPAASSRCLLNTHVNANTAVRTARSLTNLFPFLNPVLCVLSVMRLPASLIHDAALVSDTFHAINLLILKTGR